MTSEECDALKDAATNEPSTSSEPLAELKRLRQEKAALEQALQEEKAKRPVQAPALTSDLESRPVGCFGYLTDAFYDRVIGCSYT